MDYTKTADRCYQTNSNRKNTYIQVYGFRDLHDVVTRGNVRRLVFDDSNTFDKRNGLRLKQALHDQYIDGLIIVLKVVLSIRNLKFLLFSHQF